MNDEPDPQTDVSAAAPADDSARNGSDAQALLGPLQNLKAPETLHLAVTAMASKPATSRIDGLAARLRRLAGSRDEAIWARRTAPSTPDPSTPAGEMRHAPRTPGQTTPGGRTRARVRPQRWMAAPGALGALSIAAIAAIAALAIGLAIGSGGHANQTAPGLSQANVSRADVSQAARFGLAAATMKAPSASPADTAVLDRTAAGIPFPNWKPSLGWQASGARSDRLDDHAVTTVFYEPAARSADPASTKAGPGGEGYGRVGYAIVAGKALPIPGGRAVMSDGTAFRVLNVDGATALTWRRAGHTCILVARNVPSRTLMKLAVWQ